MGVDVGGEHLPPNSPMNAQPPSTPSTIVRGLLGCAGIMVAFFTVMAVIAVVMPRSDDSEPRNGSNSGTSSIASTIHEFQIGIPLLEQAGLDRRQEPSGIEYRWASGESRITFYDFASEGSIDRISACFPTDGTEIEQMLAAGLIYRLIELSADVDVTVDEFNEWFATVASSVEAVRNGRTRNFGSAPVRMQGTFLTSGRAAAMLTIGDM